MTQQINLYVRPPEEKKGPVLVTVLLLAVSGLLFTFYAEYLAAENKKLERQLSQSRMELQTQQKVLTEMKTELAKRTDPARLAAELAAVKARASEAESFLALLQKGELGTIDGYGKQLTTLAQISEPGVWLTGVKIFNAGSKLELEGRSLSAEGVLRYAGEVNRHFASQGTTLNSVELTPYTAADKSAVAFKLR